MSEPQSYSSAYYAARGQNGGRLALWFYSRVARSYVRRGAILDYGCGCGHFLKYFSRQRYDTYGFDTSADALDIAKETALPGHLFSSIEEIPTSSFDLICAIHVLEHIERPLDALQMLRGLLRPQGILMYVVPNLSGIGHTLKKRNWIGYGDPAHVALYPAQRWLTLTEAAGFTIVKTAADGLWDVPYIDWMPLSLQKLIFYPAPALQVLTGRLIIPTRWGESLVTVARVN
ncbi:MAG: class I SAM-dependent methyltransferase [Candidatus Magnetominusculus sp. LBB02]|nr:class I SAM-dependent methyltransferase [Candidatus Magnetominusculus sp. LBB02]